MKTSQPSSARRPDDTHTSMAFRVLAAVATCFLVVLGFKMQSNPIGGPLAWYAVLLVSGCVFVLADWLLALLVVGIPPGLFILALVGLMTHGG